MKLWSNQWVHAWKEDEECFRCVQMRSKVRFRQSLVVGSRSDIALLHCMRYHAAIIVVIWAFALRTQRCWFDETPPNVRHIRNEIPIVISIREATRAVRSVQHGYGLLMVIILQLNLFVFPTHGCCFRLCWGTSRGAIWRRSQRAKLGMYWYRLCLTILRCMWRVHILPDSNLFGLRSGPSCERTDSRDGIPRELPSCLKRG